MDIKSEITKIVDNIKNDKDLAKKFEKDPEKAIEGIIGRDLPDGALDQIIGAVKAKLTADTAKDVMGKLGGLFSKK